MTKQQWQSMLDAANIIEDIAFKFLKAEPTKSTIKYEIKKIKDLIHEGMNE
jgi:hypothetical protein